MNQEPESKARVTTPATPALDGSPASASPASASPTIPKGNPAPEEGRHRELPWLLVLMKAQLDNKAAERMGRSPWWLFAMVLIATTFLTAFPLVNENFTNAFRSTNPDLYPGIVPVFSHIVDSGWDLRVSGGKLVAGAEVPGLSRIGEWTVLVETRGGSLEAFNQSLQGSGDSAAQRVLFLGKSSLGIINQPDNEQFTGTWEQLEGFSFVAQQGRNLTELVPMILYTASSGSAVRSYAAVLFLMFVQMLFLSLIMGFLLSLSKVQVAGTALGRVRGAGFISSLKTSVAVAIGPALLLSVALFALPGGGQVSFILFSILYAGRIVMVYMGRFKNKRPKH